jgi:hypothetical protein
MSMTRTIARRMRRESGQRVERDAFYWRFLAFKRANPRLRYEWVGQNQWRRTR